MVLVFRVYNFLIENFESKGILFLIVGTCKFRSYRLGEKKNIAIFNFANWKNLHVCAHDRVLLSSKLIIGYLWWTISNFWMRNHDIKVNIALKKSPILKYYFWNIPNCKFLKFNVWVGNKIYFSVEQNPHDLGIKFLTKINSKTISL